VPVPDTVVVAILNTFLRMAIDPIFPIDIKIRP